MANITFSCMFGDRKSLCLDEFEAEAHCIVNLKPLSWGNAWDDVLSISLHNTGSDVSHIGNTWLGSLASMDSLYAFNASDIVHIGNEKVFLPNTWETIYLPDNPHEKLAIPWTLDTRVLVYRRDWLEKAGIDDSTAFISHEAIEETLTRLQSAGFRYPWSVSTVRNTAHISAPWVWNNGGDFRAPDQYHLAFTEPATIRGLCQFFGLYRYALPVTCGQTIEDVAAQFRSEQTGVIYTSHHLIAQLLFQKPPAFGIENVGVAKVPGTPFIGGNSLVLWKHSHQALLGIEFIRHLLSTKTQRSLAANGEQLPARTDVLLQEPFKNQPLFAPVIESLYKGRAFYSGRHWATIEKRLNATLNQLWIDLLSDSSLDISTELAKRIGHFSGRIEKTFIK
jgi:ABC-type glycerol-3-phosphate transport system substrate-binding protein